MEKLLNLFFWNKNSRGKNVKDFEMRKELLGVLSLEGWALPTCPG